MREIEDYNFKGGQLEVWTYDDQTDEDCQCTIIPMETIQDVYEDIYGNDYIGERFNATMTDTEEYHLCKPGEEIEFIQDQMEGVMTSKQVQEIIHNALNKTGIPS